jgi:hypothetical protein
MLNFKKIIFAIMFLGMSAISLTANATQISGTLPIGFLGTATITGGSDLSSFTGITVSGSGLQVGGGKTGDYLSVVSGETITTVPHSFDLIAASAPTAGNLATWDLSNATSYGTFAATTVQILQQTANFADIFVIGTQTMTGFDPTQTSVRYSLTRSVNPSTGEASYSISGTQASPPVAINTPEPVTMSMLGLGLVGWAASRRRKAA